MANVPPSSRIYTARRQSALPPQQHAATQGTSQCFPFVSLSLSAKHLSVAVATRQSRLEPVPVAPHMILPALGIRDTPLVFLNPSAEAALGVAYSATPTTRAAVSREQEDLLFLFLLPLLPPPSQVPPEARLGWAFWVVGLARAYPVMHKPGMPTHQGAKRSNDPPPPYPSALRAPWLGSLARTLAN
ncbi:hypothetical protein GQ53DRAFT_745261 [Thozetella sp. PMI_491]|nr:hypothetical protein GQ53DRAFT_745261 [Thozetella sp. PMI_491]